jgi:outer membrane protein OmpA-like peptidoglycan-associated protein
VNPTGRSALDEVAQLLKNQPTLKLMVVGHTDSTGDLDMNMKLPLIAPARS